MVNDCTRDRWARGDCPCCGSPLDWHPDADPEPIGEGVMICGRCVVNRHCEDPAVVTAMLTAIAEGNDDAIDALLAS